MKFRDSRSDSNVCGRIVGMTVVTYDTGFRSNMTVKQIVELELIEKDADLWDIHS